MKLTRFDILAAIEANNEDERRAISGYYDLLSLAENGFGWLTPEESAMIKAEIEEIISDELNHSERLSNMAQIMSGIKPAKD